MKIACVILNFNTADITEKLCQQLYGYEIVDYIIVVDNCSTDGSFEKLKYLKNDKITVLRTERNGGYGYGNNYGIKYSLDKYKVDYVLIVNPDVVVEEKTILKLVTALQNSEAVVAGGIAYNGKGEIQTSFWKIPSVFTYIFSALFLFRIFGVVAAKDNNHHVNNVNYVDCIVGCLLLVEAKIFVDYTLYDENIFLYCEETTLGIKQKNKRLKTIVVNDAIYLHLHEGITKNHFAPSAKNKKIVGKSRLYVLKNYYKVSTPVYFSAKIIYFFAGIEAKFIDKFKKILQTFHSKG